MAWGKRPAASDKPTYDMPNMDAVRRETRRLDDPRADYPLAVLAQQAWRAGAATRGSNNAAT